MEIAIQKLFKETTALEFLPFGDTKGEKRVSLTEKG